MYWLIFYFFFLVWIWYMLTGKSDRWKTSDIMNDCKRILIESNFGIKKH